MTNEPMDLCIEDGGADTVLNRLCQGRRREDRFGVCQRCCSGSAGPSGLGRGTGAGDLQIDVYPGCASGLSRRQTDMMGTEHGNQARFCTEQTYYEGSRGTRALKGTRWTAVGVGWATGRGKMVVCTDAGADGDGSRETQLWLCCQGWSCGVCAVAELMLVGEDEGGEGQWGKRAARGQWANGGDKGRLRSQLDLSQRDEMSPEGCHARRLTPISLSPS